MYTNTKKFFIKVKMNYTFRYKEIFLESVIKMKRKNYLIVIVTIAIMSIVGFDNTYADNIHNENLTQQVNQQGTANSYEFSKNDYLDLSRTNQSQNASVLTSGKQKVTVNNNTNGRFANFAEAPEQVTTLTYHTSEQFEDGMFRIYFWIDSITGPAPAAVDFKINFYSEPSLQGSVSVQTSQKMVQGTDVHTGNIGYMEFPAKTTFFAVDGDWGMAGYNGNTSIAPIQMSSVYLQNKIGQNFPEYIDPVSKKDAETPIHTDWAKLTSSPTWTTQDRYLFIKEFSEKYGNQSADYWNNNQVHHIRPRIYGGTNDFSNLMPVPVQQHQLITTWFRNY